MTTARSPQAGLIAPSVSTSAPIQASQLGVISVQQDAPTVANMLASQLGVIMVLGNGRNYLSLGPAIALPCWQPCTAYGTNATVVILNSSGVK